MATSKKQTKKKQSPTTIYPKRPVMGKMTPRARDAYIGGSSQTSSTRPSRYIAAETPGRHGGPLPGDKTGGKAIRHAYTGNGERARLYKYERSIQSPVTTGGVLRGAAKNPTAGRKARIPKKK